jgi:hypothetical protein
VSFKKEANKISNKLESIKNRFSNTAKEELSDKIEANDKMASIFLIMINGLFGLYLIVHQTAFTGFLLQRSVRSRCSCFTEFSFIG